MRYMSDFEAKKAMIEIGKRMADKGYVIADDGSLSVRIGPNAVWMTTADAVKGEMSQDMMVKVDLDGKPMLGTRVRELPEEMRIHLKIYRENPEIRTVIHGYPPVTTGMGMRGQAIGGVGVTKTLRKLGRVPLIPYKDVDTAARETGAAAGNGKGVLFQSNGCMTWGETPLEAFFMLEAMEYCSTLRMPEPDGWQEAAKPELSRPEPEPVVPRLSGVTELVKPVLSYSHTSDVIHSTKVTEKPKADVMAEVVRRTMQNYQL